MFVRWLYSPLRDRQYVIQWRKCVLSSSNHECDIWHSVEIRTFRCHLNHAQYLPQIFRWPCHQCSPSIHHHLTLLIHSTHLTILSTHQYLSSHYRPIILLMHLMEHPFSMNHRIVGSTKDQLRSTLPILAIQMEGECTLIQFMLHHHIIE